jgi:diguanylate cyclase (GGDEF)-like protein
VESFLIAADRWLGRTSRPVVVVLSLSLVGLLGLADLATGRDVSSSVFYTAPVALAAWYGGKGPAQLVCVVASATWYAADVGAGATYSMAWIPIWNSGVRLAFFAIIATLLRRLRAVLDEQRRIAESDSLTGLANARRFEASLEAEMVRSVRYARPLSVALFDLDGFKAVNDTHGHGTGDDVLRATAAALRGNVRASDLPARLGGDEFAVLLVETGGVAARDAARQMRAALEQVMRANAWPVGLSMGVYTSMGVERGTDELLRLADTLMYEAKRSGKGRTLFGSDAPS